MFARTVLVVLTFSFIVGCSAEYHARRQQRYEERLALREQHRQARLAQRQQRMYSRCSNMQFGYERGHNDGIRRNQMNSGWISRCPAELQQQQYQAYNQGYQEGVANAPQVPQVQVRYTSQPAVSGQVYVVGSPAVTPCTFSSDCGGGDMSCRSWNGQNVCMGYGSVGAPCWFGSDCLSGSCSQRTCR